MNYSNSSWSGYLPINGIMYEFVLNISPMLDDIRVSFPQCGQLYVPVSQYFFQNNCLTLFISHIGEQYKLVFRLNERLTLKGVIFEYGLTPIDFTLIYQSTFTLGTTIYQPCPQQEKLIEILMQSGDINFSKLDVIEYPNLDNAYYGLLRDMYRLNNFFVNKPLFDRAIMLTKWVNKSIVQAGMVVLPIQRDAISLLDYALRGKKALNCKGCSLILTDCLMALGIKARTVHCMSSDRFDPESHYITEMYYNEKEKWIALDAAYGCFFESNGVALGIKDIREKLTQGQEICLKSSNNVLAGKFQNRIIYGLYKNFYRFEYFLNYNPGYASVFSGVEKILIEPVEENKYENS